MQATTVQRTIALALLLIGLFLLIDQVSIILNIDITSIIRPLLIVAGFVSLIAGLILFRDSFGE